MRHVEAYHRHVQPARENRLSGLRVAPDVELRSRREVAFSDRTAHEDDSVDAVGAVLVEVARDVGERPGRYESDRAICVSHPLEDARGRTLGAWLAAGRRQRGAVEPALPVHVCRDNELPLERSLGARRHRHAVTTDELEDT